VSAPHLTPERWAQIKRILQEALELPSGERAAHVERECAGDALLRGEVESLLAADADAASFLDAPVDLALAPAETQLAPGQRVGLYQIVQLIGEGGMGSVYQALRDDIRKLVAVKVVKRGMHSDFVLSRFANERQILAHFDHPYITKFLDSGLTADGRPYFVMEFIAGRQIDEYCDEHRLTTRDRLRLFLKVCAGVEYAHRNLVVHRDLKPRNILVTPEGDPKLLDFGIAKILEEEPGAGTPTATVTVVRMMTPEYASPEQVRGAPVSTASDVYSLGVLLYELLTGHPPYRLKGRMPHEAAEVICRQDPPRPSTMVHRTEPADTTRGTSELTPELVSEARASRPAKLGRTLAGDLDNIVLRALEKEPERRYGSVEQLAEDIRRYLDGLPVLARGKSMRYRAAKFVRRHKAAVAAAAVVGISLVGGITATAWEAKVADEQRARAERRFQDVRTLANSLLFEIHDAIQDLPGSTPARELLVKRALQYLDGLSTEAGGDAGLERELAMAYERVADVQGGYHAANLGDHAGAIASYRKALAIRESLRQRIAANAEVRRDLVRTHGKLSEALLESGHPAEAMEHSRQLLALAKELAAANPDNATDQRNLASAYADLGWKQAGSGDWKAGLENLRGAVEMFEKLQAANPKDGGTARRLAVAYERAGSVLANSAEEYGEAVAMHRKELALVDQLRAADKLNAMLDRLAAYAHIGIGTDLSLAGDHAGARPQLEEARAMLQRLAAADPKNAQLRLDVVHSSGLVADEALKAAQPEKAVVLARKALETLGEMPPGPERNMLAAAHHFRIGKAYQQMAARIGLAGQEVRNLRAEALVWFRRSLQGLEEAQRRQSLAGRDLAMLEEARVGIRDCERSLAAQ
jgi:serine/threonine protein kinase/tetratricopeptide (TPR) repeat protein